MNFAPRARDKGRKDVPHPSPHESLVDASRIPFALGRGTRSISGVEAPANEDTAIDSGELDLWVR
jgi:hypothetical protein